MMRRINSKGDEMLRAALVCFALIGLSESLVGKVLHDVPRLRKTYGLDQYPVSPQLANVRVLVIDRGCEGFVPGKAMLPDNAICSNGVDGYPEEFPGRKPLKEDILFRNGKSRTVHGLTMAQIIWEMTGAHAEGPQMFIATFDGFAGFQRATEFAKWWRPDIILYAQVSPWAGNGDGTGPLNHEVSSVVSDPNMIWINAAGNFANRIFHRRIETKDNYVTMGDGRNALELKVRADAKATLELVWNRINDDPTLGTDRDLDLYVYDSDKKIFKGAEIIVDGETTLGEARAERKQVVKETEGMDSKYSTTARERLTLSFKKNSDQEEETYYVYVADRSGNFDSADEFRIVLTIDSSNQEVMTKNGSLPTVELFPRSHRGMILPPADHPKVFAVGDFSSATAWGPTLAGLAKPDVFVEDAYIKLNDGTLVSGTSNASAIFAGIVTVLKAKFPNLNEPTLRLFLKNLSRPRFGRFTGLTALGGDQQKWAKEYAQIEARHPGLYEQLRNHFGEYPVIVGQRENGTYVFGFRQSPAEITTLFDKAKGKDSSKMNFYVTSYLGVVTNQNGQPQRAWQALGFPRATGDDSGIGAELPPWIEANSPSGRYSDYAEVCRAETEAELAQAQRNLEKRIGVLWKTPTPDEGNNAFTQR